MNKENSERSQNLKEGDQVVLLTKAGAGLVRPVRGEVTGHKDQIVLGGEDEPQHGTVFSIRLEEGSILQTRSEVRTVLVVPDTSEAAFEAGKASLVALTENDLTAEEGEALPELPDGFDARVEQLAQPKKSAGPASAAPRRPPRCPQRRYPRR